MTTSHRQQASLRGSRTAVPGTNETDSWPGPGLPTRLLAGLLVVGALIGGTLGALTTLGDDGTTVVVGMEVVPDVTTLTGPLETSNSVVNDTSFILSEIAYLDFERDAQQDVDPDTALSVTRVGTSQVVEIAGTSASETQATAAVDRIFDAYVERRVTGATNAVQGDLTVVQQRLAALGAAADDESGALLQERQRLLAQEADLQSALQRAQFVVPVLYGPATQPAAAASSTLLAAIIGAVGGMVVALVLVLGRRLVTRRLLDARELATVGISLLPPRVPAGRPGQRGRGVPLRRPVPAVAEAARAISGQLLPPGSGPASVVLVDGDRSSGAAEVAWSVAWVNAAAGSAVTLYVPAEDHAASTVPTVVLPTLSVVDVAAGTDGGWLQHEVAAQLAAGRHVLLAATWGAPEAVLDSFLPLAERAVVVVGEGVARKESVIATTNGLGSLGDTDFVGAVVTTDRRAWGAPVELGGPGSHRDVDPRRVEAAEA